MANPTNREELKQFCLRKLGKPVLEINVADEQLEDRIDDALKMYHDFHYDGIERVIIKSQITQTDKDNGYLSMSDSVVSIEKILDLNTGSSNEILFDAQFHMTWDALYAFNQTPTQLQYYTATQENLTLINQILNGKQPLRYRRHTDRLYIDMDWDKVAVDDFIIVQAYQIIDPNTYTQVWSDRWLREYTTELFREQWGTNLIKYSGVQMPGGLTFNGEKILDDAKTRIRELEEELRNTYEEPPTFYMG
tara:strand:- start:5079 stop:5825 length:747 start_codon:yes stop_codon:yes gene_type:complete